MQSNKIKVNNQKVSPIDKHIGVRIRERRIALGLSLQNVAAKIGITYQQTHKYEVGINKTSTTRLLDIANVLGVPISWFLDGFDKDHLETLSTSHHRMALELSRNFALIRNEGHREALVQMARSMATAEQDD